MSLYQIEWREALLRSRPAKGGQDDIEDSRFSLTIELWRRDQVAGLHHKSKADAGTIPHRGVGFPIANDIS